MTRTEDVATLPDRVRSEAIWLDNGEVMWPYDHATAALNALADAGYVVLGVDARPQHDAAAVTEVAISSFKPSGEQDDAERGRQSALDAIDRVSTITGWDKPFLLLTWR